MLRFFLHNMALIINLNNESQLVSQRNAFQMHKNAQKAVNAKF